MLGVAGSEEACRLDHQKGPQPLAAAKARVAHRVEQPARPRPLAVDRRRRQQAVEQRFRVVRSLAEPLLKDRVDVNAFLHRLDACHAFRYPAARLAADRQSFGR